MLQRRTTRLWARILVAAAVTLFWFSAWIGLVYYENTLDFGVAFATALDLSTWAVLVTILFVAILGGLILLYVLGEPLAPPSGRPVTVATPVAVPAPVVEAPVEALPLLVPPAPPPAERIIAPAPRPERPVSRTVQCTWCGTHFSFRPRGSLPMHSRCPHCSQDVVLDPTQTLAAPPGDPLLSVLRLPRPIVERLNAARVFTLEQLRAVDASDLARVAHVSLPDAERLRSLCDLLRVRGMDPRLADLLFRAGVRSTQTLAQEDPARLARTLQAVQSSSGALAGAKTDVPASRLKAFVDAARALPAP